MRLRDDQIKTAFAVFLFVLFVIAFFAVKSADGQLHPQLGEHGGGVSTHRGGALNQYGCPLSPPPDVELKGGVYQTRIFERVHTSKIAAVTDHPRYTIIFPMTPDCIQGGVVRTWRLTWFQVPPEDGVLEEWP